MDGFPKTVILFVLLVFSFRANTQVPKNTNLELAQRLTRRILYLQLNHEKDFPVGMVPAYREYNYNKGVLKPDENIFFTGLTLFTLRYLQPYLDTTSRRICDSIFLVSAPLYERFRNKSGRPTYAFWRTDTPVVFPHSGWMNLFNTSQALPDDLDDTAVLLMAMHAADSTVQRVHLLMQSFANKHGKKIRSSAPYYRELPAYSTWFGKKMAIEFDVGVMANILYMVHLDKLPYSAADSASLQYIEMVIRRRDHVKNPDLVSPYYNRTPVLLYHIARLMEIADIPALERLKPQLIKDAQTCYKKAGSFMDKIILSTALLRWGVSLPEETLAIHTTLEQFVETQNFVFFVANIASFMPYSVNKWLGRSRLAKFYFYSPAYNEALLLEYLVLSERVANSSK